LRALVGTDALDSSPSRASSAMAGLGPKRDEDASSAAGGGGVSLFWEDKSSVRRRRGLRRGL